jgi:hypothetical protein
MLRSAQKKRRSGRKISDAFAGLTIIGKPTRQLQRKGGHTDATPTKRAAYAELIMRMNEIFRVAKKILIFGTEAAISDSYSGPEYL